jgi:hypothetical protein
MSVLAHLSETGCPVDELAQSWHTHGRSSSVELFSRAEGCVPTQGRGRALEQLLAVAR